MSIHATVQYQTAHTNSTRKAPRGLLELRASMTGGIARTAELQRWTLGGLQKTRKAWRENVRLNDD